MSRRSRREVPAEPVELEVSGLSHDGRGVGSIDGKRLFISGGLPGERVRAKLTARKRRMDEAEVLEVLHPSPSRVQPRCRHFGYCGGCALQHCDSKQQLLTKQETLLQNLKRIGGVEPEQVLEPLTGPIWHYRRKARLSARYVHSKGRLLLGFRERQGRFVADLSECHVLDQRVASQLPELAALLGSLSIREQLPQVEVSCGDETCALIVRHLVPLSAADLEALRTHARRHGIAILLQPAGIESIHPLEPAAVQFGFAVPEFNLNLKFGPADFIQVNTELNRRMIGLAVSLLDPGPEDRVLDLFCGIGNFSLPLARRSAEVVGVEGDQALVERARHNANENGLGNALFFVDNLAEIDSAAPWLRQRFDRVLLDPPRSGALTTLPHIAASGAKRVVYVSCHPGSLARDAGQLVRRHRFRLKSAGVMDMFPHTAHVESIAMFEAGR